MKVFISWSGETSRQVAKTLEDWIPYVLQDTRPFVSSSDINVGEHWQEKLISELQKSTFGIICLTEHNIDAPWINFEAGAMSNTLQKSSVVPFLFYVDTRDIRGPLQQFQATHYGDNDDSNRADLFRLVSSINMALPPDQLVPEERLKRQFDMWWPECRNALNQIYANEPVQGMSQYDWLYFKDDILKAQDIKCKDVWIVTSDLSAYSSDSKALSIMENNLTKGTQYIFIVPESPDNLTASDELNRRFKNCPNKPITNLYETKQFDSVAAANYVIINPDYESEYEQKMYVELPIKSYTAWWAEVKNDAMQKFVTRFRSYANLNCKQSSNSSITTKPHNSKRSGKLETTYSKNCGLPEATLTSSWDG